MDLEMASQEKILTSVTAAPVEGPLVILCFNPCGYNLFLTLAEKISAAHFFDEIIFIADGRTKCRLPVPKINIRIEFVHPEIEGEFIRDQLSLVLELTKTPCTYITLSTNQSFETIVIENARRGSKVFSVFAHFSEALTATYPPIKKIVKNYDRLDKITKKKKLGDKNRISRYLVKRKILSLDQSYSHECDKDGGLLREICAQLGIKCSYRSIYSENMFLGAIPDVIFTFHKTEVEYFRKICPNTVTVEWLCNYSGRLTTDLNFNKPFLLFLPAFDLLNENDCRIYKSFISTIHNKDSRIKILAKPHPRHVNDETYMEFWQNLLKNDSVTFVTEGYVIDENVIVATSKNSSTFAESLGKANIIVLDNLTFNGHMLRSSTFINLKNLCYVYNESDNTIR